MSTYSPGFPSGTGVGGPASPCPPVLPSDPDVSTISPGYMWYNSTEGEVKFYDGTSIGVFDIVEGTLCDAFGTYIGDQ